MFSLHTPNHLQTLLAKIQAGVLIHDQALVEAEKINKLDLKKAPKVKDKDSEVKPHEQDNPVDDEEHRCATDDMGMQNPDKMPKDKDREDVVVQLESKADDLADEKDRLARQLHGKTSFFDLYAWQKQEVEDQLKASTKAGTNETATGRDPEGFVRFATDEEAFLWEDEILGQLSDGAWENATPHDHWQAWGRAGVEVGSPAGYYGFRPKRTSYGLNSLIEYIGDRMQTHLGLMRILKAKGVNPDEFKHNMLPDDPSDFDSVVKYAQGAVDVVGTEYWAEKLQKWRDMGITREMVVMAKEKTSETDLRKVLRDIQKTIKVRLPDAGPEKGLEPEKEPELKKEEPKVTRPEKVDLLAPGRKKPETPRGEPGAKKFPAFSKEGKIPSKPSEAGEEETKKALKEEDQRWEVFDRLEGLADQNRLKQLGSLVQELLNDFTHEGFEVEDVEEYLLGKVKDIITSQGLAGRKIEGKAPISTDTAEEAEKKLLEDWSNSPEGVDSVQLTQGIEIEMEHTTDPEEAKKIALDHLAEDPRYYTKLKKMEAGACDDVQVEEGSGPEEEQYKISPKDLDVLKNAIAAKKLENGYPSEEEMVDQLSQLEDIVDPETAEEGDVRMMWLKYVQIPKAYALVGESKIKEDASASFRDRLFAFLDHSWQEDTEIEVVKMINQYRAKFQTAPVKAVQDYLRNFVEANTILSNQHLSDAFTSQLEELMGQAARTWEGKQLPFEGKIQEGICWECGGKTEGKEKFCCPECEATHEDRPEEKEEWTDPQMESTVVGPSFEAETLMKEVLAAMKKYKWNYEEAVKGFAAKNDMDPAELEQLLSKATESGHSSDRPVREQEEVQYVSVADGIVDKKTADDLATKVKGTVATDDNDPKKFKVITRKDLGTV